MANTVKIRRQGGATVFSIPPALMKMMGADVGTELTLSVDNGSLVATPTLPRKRYTLAELLEGAEEMTALNRQTDAWETVSPLGNELP
jgi:antitoxin ChpS